MAAPPLRPAAAAEHDAPWLKHPAWCAALAGEPFVLQDPWGREAFAVVSRQPLVLRRESDGGGAAGRTAPAAAPAAQLELWLPAVNLYWAVPSAEMAAGWLADLAPARLAEGRSVTSRLEPAGDSAETRRAMLAAIAPMRRAAAARVAAPAPAVAADPQQARRQQLLADLEAALRALREFEQPAGGGRP